MKPSEPNDATALRELETEFTVVRELGRGATATVYLARRYGAGQLVAIKLVRPHVADAQALERLDREARTVARLSHPNIVRHYEFRHLTGGAVAIVMQYVAGETLATRLARTPQRPIAEVEHVLRDVANALEFAHASAVIHRDIKPGNILLEAETKSALLSDFGIAKFLDGDAKLTLDGVTIGTPAYMSPEQIDGRSLDGRSDLYSLGVVGWEMLTGSKPWAGESLYSVIYKQKFEALPPLEELRPDVPPRVALAIAGVLHKKRSLRLPSATEFLRQLSQDQPTLSARSRQWVAAASLEQDLEAASAAPTLQFPIPSALPTPSTDAPSLVPPAPPPTPAAAHAPALAPTAASATAPALVPAPAPAAAASPPLSPLRAPTEVPPAPAPAVRPAVAAVSLPIEESSAVEPSPPRAPVATVGAEPLRRRPVFASLSIPSVPEEASRRRRPNVAGVAAVAAMLVVALLGSFAVARRGAAGRPDTTPAAAAPRSRQTASAAPAAAARPANRPRSVGTTAQTAGKRASAASATRPGVAVAVAPSGTAAAPRPSPPRRPSTPAAAASRPTTTRIVAVTPSAPAPSAPPVVVRAAPRVLARPALRAPADPLLRAAALRISERRYAAAGTLVDSAIALSPQTGRAYTLRARLRLERNQLRDAWSDAEMAGRLGDRWGAEAVTAMVEARARDSVAARARVKRLGAALAGNSTLGEDEGVQLALAMTAVGDQGAAFQALERIRPVTASLWRALDDPAFASLRRSARFPQLVKRLERAETRPGH